MTESRDEEVELLRKLVAQNEAAQAARRQRNKVVGWIAVIVVVVVLVAVPITVAAQRKAAERAKYDRDVCELTQVMIGSTSAQAREYCRP